MYIEYFSSFGNKFFHISVNFIRKASLNYVQYKLFSCLLAMSINHNQTKSLEDEKIDILLQLLICPKTGCTLKFDKKYQIFLSESGKLVFYYENGIPNMKLEDSNSMDDFYSDKALYQENLICVKEESQS